MKLLRQIYNVALRECNILRGNPIYLFCIIIFPLLTVLFFTSMMHEGQPEKMPIGVVDMDHSSVSRALTRKLNAFQTSNVIKHYNNINEARQAIQQNEIYAFIYYPRNMAKDLLASRQPTLSFYYSNVYITSGALLFRDLKTISNLGGAAVGSAKLSALGKRSYEIQAFLQPVIIDLHPINNPEINYNVYLSSSLIPACLMLFIFLITAYSIGTELKFNRSKAWLATANENISVAIIGKMLPQFLAFLSIFYIYYFYVYGILGFPFKGGVVSLLMLGLISVLAAQGFGIFAFGILPSLRMSMSICSLWAVLSFSVMGATFPLSAMSPAVTTLAQLFPMRHYFVVYQTCVFNGYPITDAVWNVVALLLFACLPLFVLPRIKKAMLEYVYIP